MFYVRGILVCVSVFVVVYVTTSWMAGCWWRAIARIAGDSSNLLFALRMAPAVLAVISVAALVLPSYVRFEPRVGEETIGVVPLLLSTSFALLATTGIWRVWQALRSTRKCVREWTVRASHGNVAGAVLVNSKTAPPVVLAGVSKSMLLISSAAYSALTATELERAIAHEMSHRRASDNLKKLILRAFQFPGMESLEKGWREAIEYSADAHAVESAAEAVELASALVKIARLQAAEMPDLVSGLVDGAPSGLERRIERLLHWRAEPRRAASWRHWHMAVIAALAVICACPSLLRGVHAITELLMR